MRFCFFLLLVFCIMMSCKNKYETEKVSVENRFSVELPYHLKKTKGLNEDAILQYSNAVQELYVVVLEEKKDKLLNSLNKDSLSKENNVMSLEKYSSLCYERLENHTEELKDFDVKNSVINGLNAKDAEFVVKISGVNMYYNYVILEGTDYYYQLFIWTLLRHKRDHHSSIRHIISTFCEY
ncbi:hypothetical protein [Myroides indicus]|uniref:Uncharacterized protein n=1 Tax=Myroides indicus TaxID=1323422 RepID=A0A4R7F2U0_9FLAO|nr:hypothetical protein [Myroides indicus]TDS60255.1 hypothetical protein C8P70_109112 [Myroides indicus]